MKNIVVTLLLACTVFSDANAADVWTGEKEIVSIQVVEHGGFLIYFSTEVNSICTNAGTKSIYVYPVSSPGSLVNDAGLSALLSTALVALTTGMMVNVMYDDATNLCLGRYLIILK